MAQHEAGSLSVTMPTEAYDGSVVHYCIENGMWSGNSHGI